MATDLESGAIEVTLEQLLEGSSSSPITLRDFMSYLVNFRHAAELLQFLLCIKHYEKEFAYLLGQDAEGLSKCWTNEDEHQAKQSIRRSSSQETPFPSALRFKLSICSLRSFLSAPSCSRGIVLFQPQSNTQSTASGDAEDDTSVQRSSQLSTVAPWDASTTDLSDTSHRTSLASAEPELYNGNKHLKAYISRVVATYIIPGIGSKRELNLSDPQRKQILYALQRCNHPSAFGVAMRIVEKTLHRIMIPDYNKYLNQNPEYVQYLKQQSRPWKSLLLGICLIIVGIVQPITLACSHYNQAYRVFGLLAFLSGIVIYFCAYHRLDLMSNRGFDGDECLELFCDGMGVGKWVKEVFTENVGNKAPKTIYGTGVVLRQGVLMAFLVGSMWAILIFLLPVMAYF